MKNLRLLILLVLPMLQPFPAAAQHAALKGRLVDGTTKAPLEGANIWLTGVPDSSHHFFTTSKQNGSFEFPNLKLQPYVLTVSFVGYKTHTKTIRLDDVQKDLGALEMEQSAIGLKEVVVEGKQPPVTQVGDTTELNARAFKTNPDATAEDLVSKMPTISIENSTVKAQGEDVQQVLVDGRPFFGGDPMLSLRNLPADAIEKIQVFDKLSDQAEFTGFDDGRSIKTLNIITRLERRFGQFGKVYSGYGDQQRYAAGGNINSFDGDRRLSALGLSNNINQQNFSLQDILGAVSSVMRGPGLGGFGGGGGFGGRGGGRPGFGGGGGRALAAAMPNGAAEVGNFLVGQQNGITSAHSVGLNYSDGWSRDFDVNGSYFFNRTDNENAESLWREYIVSQDSSTFYNEQSKTENKNFNHRFNFKVEYAIDSSNSVITRPQISFQSNRKSSAVGGISSLSDDALLSQSTSDSRSSTDGYNGSANLVFRHKFGTPGRTLSLDLTVRSNRKEKGSNLTSLSEYYAGTRGNETTDQKTDGRSDGSTISSRLVYTEPMSTGGLLQLNYNPSYTKSSSDTKAHRFDPTTGDYTRLDPRLSNTFENEYTTQSAGLGYRYRQGGFNLMAGVSYQIADLHNIKTYPISSTIDRTFYSLLPNAMLMYNLGGRSNLRINYRTSTNAPSINQLQDVLDNSNPLLLSTGNPDLKQATTHTIVSRYVGFNMENARSLFLFFTVSYTKDYIGTSTFIAGRDTVVSRGIRLNQGTQLSFPVNLDHSWNVNSLFIYSLPVDFVKSNLNLTAGVAFAQTPGLVNSVQNTSNAYSISQGLVLGSNISEELDFTLAYNANYSISTYSLQPELNDKYFYHTGSLRFNWIFGEGFVLRNEVANTLYSGLGGGRDENYVIWNVGVGKKFFENNRGELRLGATDLLNQNTSIHRTVTDVSIENTTNQVLGRYAMLTFTYTVR